MRALAWAAAVVLLPVLALTVSTDAAVSYLVGVGAGYLLGYGDTLGSIVRGRL